MSDGTGFLFQQAAYLQRIFRTGEVPLTIKELRRLYIYLHERKSRYAAGALFLLFTNAFALLIPWYMKLAVEGLQHPETMRRSPAFCAVAIILLAVVSCITRVFSRTLFLNAARIIEFRLRDDLFGNLQRQDMSFFSFGRTGDIISRFSNDLTNVRMLAGFGAMSAVNTLILYIATITLMLRIHPWLTFWAVLPFPVMVLIVKRVSRHIFQRSVQAQEELARLSSLVEESASAAPLIKSYCREEYFREMFASVSNACLTVNLRLARLRGLIIPVMAGATGAGTLIIMFAGGRLVIGNDISLGDFVAFSGYLSMLVWPTAVMGWILTLVQRGAASMSRISAVLDAVPLVRENPDDVVLDSIGTGIELKGLSFRYGETCVLEDLSLHITAGEKLGITGPVGSGKTTLLRLLLRLLPVPDNRLFINGIDINRVSPASLRTLIGYVPQEPFLFSRSIAANACYGSSKVEQGAIEEALARAGFREDVERFSEGMETLVGERGVTLSSGQKQRLSIARALAAEPRMLLLDDPLSSVDAGREDEILQGLADFGIGRTMVTVSHRMAALRHCDRIIVLDKGRIVEQGAPEDLLMQGGTYAGMYRMQQLREELTGDAGGGRVQ